MNFDHDNEWTANPVAWEAVSPCFPIHPGIPYQLPPVVKIEEDPFQPKTTHWDPVLEFEQSPPPYPPMHQTVVESNIQTSKKRGPRSALSVKQRQSHNRVEKKYRQNINSKIATLQAVIPWTSEKMTAYTVTLDMPPSLNTDHQLPKMNKSAVLDVATNYILYLQSQEVEILRELQCLREQLEKYRSCHVDVAKYDGIH